MERQHLRPRLLGDSEGPPNKALAEQYIAYTLTPKPQQGYAQHIAYGPTNIAAIKSLDAKTLANLPNSPANGKNAVLEDIGFWTDHSDGSSSVSPRGRRSNRRSGILMQPAARRVDRVARPSAGSCPAGENR